MDVSVIVPVYDTEAYIDECIGSLIGQSGDVTLEIVVVDDASPDNAINKVRAWQSEAEKAGVTLSVYQNFQNMGLAQTRNIGVFKAKGRYIGFVDSDDHVDESMFDLLYSEAIKYDLDGVSCDMVKFDQSRWVNLSGLSPAENTSVCNKLYRKQFLKKNDIIFARGQLFEDELFSYHFTFCQPKVKHVDRGLYFYRANPGGICRNKQTEKKRLLGRVDSSRAFLARQYEMGLLDDHKHECIELICRNFVLAMYGSSALKDKLHYLEAISQLFLEFGVEPKQSKKNSFFINSFIKIQKQKWRIAILPVVAWMKSYSDRSLDFEV